jgi:pSer/pThr/pTyr-binding forkhead associated (FHA) protein
VSAVAEQRGALSPRDHGRARRLEPLDPGPHLLIADDDGALAALPVAEGVTTIGRSMQADVRLDDHTVSRRHAVLLRTGHHVTIADERSTNGVRVNGRFVARTELRDADVVELGRVRLRFVQPDAPR